MKRSRIFNFLLILALLGIILIGPKFLQTNAAYIPAIGDNMGNHTATKNINLNGFWLSGNGGNNGIFIGANGNIGFGTDSVSGAKVTLADHTTPAGGIKFGIDTGSDNDGGIIYTRTNNELTFPNIIASNYYASNNLVLSNTITANNGSETNPGITSNVHPTTGLSAIAGPNLLFLISGSEKMRLSHTGNVGIGTTDPQEKLAVNGSFHAQTICLDNGTDCLLTALSPGLASCGRLFDQDGNNYQTVVIGDQCWMAENLKTGIFIDTTNGVQDPVNGIIEKSCYKNNDIHCLSHGGLYSWDEAMMGSTDLGAQGVCPQGWHIPTIAEFDILKATVANITGLATDQTGNALKAIGEGFNDGVGLDLVRFKGFLVGTYNGNSFTTELNTRFWTSNSATSAYSYSLTLTSTANTFSQGTTSKNHHLSIRCIKNQ